MPKKRSDAFKWAQYLMERLPQTLLAPELQMTRIDVLQRGMQRDPQAFMEKFVPMFLNGLNRSPDKRKQVNY